MFCICQCSCHSPLHSALAIPLYASSACWPVHSLICLLGSKSQNPACLHQGLAGCKQGCMTGMCTKPCKTYPPLVSAAGLHLCSSASKISAGMLAAKLMLAVVSDDCPYLGTRMLNESHLASCPTLDKLVRAVHSIIHLLQPGRRSRHTRISSWDAQLEGGRKGVDPALISPASSGELTTVRPKVRCIMSLLITAFLSCCHRSMLLLSLISTPSTTSVFH